MCWVLSCVFGPESFVSMWFCGVCLPDWGFGFVPVWGSKGCECVFGSEGCVPFVPEKCVPMLDLRDACVRVVCIWGVCAQYTSKRLLVCMCVCVCWVLGHVNPSCVLGSLPAPAMDSSALLGVVTVRRLRDCPVTDLNPYFPSPCCYVCPYKTPLTPAPGAGGRIFL